MPFDGSAQGSQDALVEEVSRRRRELERLEQAVASRVTGPLMLPVQAGERTADCSSPGCENTCSMAHLCDYCGQGPLCRLHSGPCRSGCGAHLCGKCYSEHECPFAQQLAPERESSGGGSVGSWQEIGPGVVVTAVPPAIVRSPEILSAVSTPWNFVTPAEGPSPAGRPAQDSPLESPSTPRRGRAPQRVRSASVPCRRSTSSRSASVKRLQGKLDFASRVQRAKAASQAAPPPDLEMLPSLGLPTACKERCCATARGSMSQCSNRCSRTDLHVGYGSHNCCKEHDCSSEPFVQQASPPPAAHAAPRHRRQAYALPAELRGRSGSRSATPPAPPPGLSAQPMEWRERVMGSTIPQLRQ